MKLHSFWISNHMPNDYVEISGLVKRYWILGMSEAFLMYFLIWADLVFSQLQFGCWLRGRMISYAWKFSYIQALQKLGFELQLGGYCFHALV